MVSPDTALRRLLRDMEKLLRPYGFEGAEPSWSRVEAGGVARVGRTRVTRTWTDGQQSIGFGLTLDATPVSWWAFRDWCDRRHGRPGVPIEAATGPGLITDPPVAGESTAPWILGVDPARPGHALQADIDAIRAQLPHRVHTYARAALRLLDSDRYLDVLLDQPAPTARTWEAAVILLAEHGPGARLDDAVRRWERSAPDDPAAVDDVRAYVRYRTSPSVAEDDSTRISASRSTISTVASTT